MIMQKGEFRGAPVLQARRSRADHRGDPDAEFRIMSAGGYGATSRADWAWRRFRCRCRRQRNSPTLHSSRDRRALRIADGPPAGESRTTFSAPEHHRKLARLMGVSNPFGNRLFAHRQPGKNRSAQTAWLSDDQAVVDASRSVPGMLSSHQPAANCFSRSSSTR
jgi:hypothetical protein